MSNWQSALDTATHYATRMGKRFGVAGMKIQGRWIYYVLPLESPAWQGRDQNRRIDGQA